jgi:hypothetical protein
MRAVWSPAGAQDLQVCHGVDWESELVEAIAQQCALEVQMECRREADAGNALASYTLHLPPFLAPSFVDPAEYSVNRGYRIGYTKVRA